jgi:hypothetical protein
MAPVIGRRRRRPRSGRDRGGTMAARAAPRVASGMAKPWRAGQRSRAETEEPVRRQPVVGPQQAAGDDDHAPGPSLRKAELQDADVRTGGGRRGARKPRATPDEQRGAGASQRRSKPLRMGRGTARTRAGRKKSVRGRRSTAGR